MKVVAWLLLVVLLLVGGAAAYLYFNSGALLKGAIEEYGSEAVGTRVSVASVSLDLATESGELRGLTIANPPGYGAGAAVAIDVLGMGIDVASSSEQLVVLRELTVDGAAINVVAKGQDTNLQALMDGMDETASSSGGAGDSTATPEPNVIIDRVRFTNVNTSVQSDILGETALDLPDVRRPRYRPQRRRRTHRGGCRADSFAHHPRCHQTAGAQRPEARRRRGKSEGEGARKAERRVAEFAEAGLSAENVVG